MFDDAVGQVGQPMANRPLRPPEAAPIEPPLPITCTPVIRPFASGSGPPWSMCSVASNSSSIRFSRPLVLALAVITTHPDFLASSARTPISAVLPAPRWPSSRVVNPGSRGPVAQLSRIESVTPSRPRHHRRPLAEIRDERIGIAGASVNQRHAQTSCAIVSFVRQLSH